MIIKTQQLGLAAFMKMQGIKLLSVSGRTFEFESEKELSDWEIVYANSEASRFNTSLIELQQLRRGNS